MMMLFVNFYAIPLKVAATELSEGVGTNAIDKFKEGASGKLDDSNNKTIKTTQKIFGAVKNIVQVVSLFIAVIMLLFVTIKYMVSSVSERAEIKKHAVVYVIGALIIFSVNGIITIIQKFSTNIEY